MVISDEIKFPRPIVIDPYKTEKKVAAVDAVHPVIRVGAFKKEWIERKGGIKTRKKPEQLTVTDENDIRRLIARINHHFTSQKILLHLILTKQEDGFTLDVYDSTDGAVSTVIHDIIINIEELPALLRNLQKASGILINTVS